MPLPLCAGQLWLKRKKGGAEGGRYDSKPARKIFAQVCLGKREPHTADISSMRLSPAEVAYVELAVRGDGGGGRGAVTWP